MMSVLAATGIAPVWLTRPSFDGRCTMFEIEHKYLVTDDAWRSLAEAPGVEYRQGYIAESTKSIVRVRVLGTDRAQLTIKGQRVGSTRPEFEYDIPVPDGIELLDRFAQGRELEKTRFRVPFGGRLWEVDVYGGENGGLVTAEVELEHEGEMFEVPPWVGADITEDDRYANANLASVPWNEWADDDE